jgi:hypothetical protein
MRRATTVLALVLLLVPATAAAANGEVRPGRSIAGITLGLTEAGLRERLGAPDRIVTRPNPFFGQERRLVFGPRRMAATVGPSRRVLLITTRNRAHRTDRGVGVGSTRRTVDTKVRGSTCMRALCSVGRFRAGQKVTTFRLKEGRVVSIDLGYVLD